MKKVVLFFALAVGLLARVSTLQAQTLNMSRYITLTVTDGAAIKLNFKAAATRTPIRIVSGSNTQKITVGTDWIGYAIYTTDSTTMTVYGDIVGFDCSGNGANLIALDVSHNTQLEVLDCSSNQLTSLDLSHNTQLEELYCFFNQLTTLDVSQNTELRLLYCYDNPFTTAALDGIYCDLPDRIGNTNGVIQPVYNSSSSNIAAVLATNAQNAIAKNWKVQYYDTKDDIPATSGSYVCGSEPNMNRYITLTVKKDSAIKLNFQVFSYNTPVRIVSGSNTQDTTVNNYYFVGSAYTAGSTTMTIYGDIIGFDCSGNGANLTALDPSHNTQLEVLNCSKNQLTALDVSHNTQLQKLFCHGNKFSAQALDDIYCTLPDRTSNTDGVIKPVFNSSSSYNDTVLATNAQNATSKNWKVQYAENYNTDIPATTGSYVCSGGGTTYDLKIAGVDVTSANCSNLSVIDSVSGTVKYDPSTKTLALQNATIKINTTNAIESNIDGLTIKVIGTNNLTTVNRAALVFTRPLTITGGGVLNANSGIYYGAIYAYAYGTNLTIDGCTVNAKGGYGIRGFNGSISETLTIKNATVTAEGTVYGSITNFASLTLDGCAITQPAGAAFSTSLHAVALSGAKVKSKVVISKNSTDIAEAAAEPALTLYPNPVADVLYLSATARTIRIYNVYGTEVAHAADTDRIDVAHLPAGIYTVKADGTVAKMVKR